MSAEVERDEHGPLRWTSGRWVLWIYVVNVLVSALNLAVQDGTLRVLWVLLLAMWVILTVTFLRRPPEVRLLDDGRAEVRAQAWKDADTFVAGQVRDLVLESRKQLTVVLVDGVEHRLMTQERRDEQRVKAWLQRHAVHA